MASRKSYTHSFAGGEMSPLMLGHIEDEGYRTGFARGRNMIVLPTGAATKRPQFEFVRAAKAGVSPIRLFPFVYGDGDAYAMEWGPNHVRLHAEGSTLMVLDGPTPPTFIATKQIASYDDPNNEFDTTTAHGLATGDEIVFGGSPLAALPTGLFFFTVYFAIVIDANTLALATTLANAQTSTKLAFSGAPGSGTHYIHRVYRQGDLVSYPTAGGPYYYCAIDSLTGTTPATIAAATCTASANIVTAVAHGLFQGQPIVFALNGGTLPPEIVAGTTYYANPQSADTFTILATFGGAQVTFAGSSTGSPTFQRVAHWYAQPSTGELEFPHDLGADGLAALNYDQSFDVWTFCSKVAPAGTLSREAITRWLFRDLVFAPSIAAPTLSFSTTYGESYSLTLPASSADFSAGGSTNHGLLAGDVVYLEGGAVGSGSAMTGVAGTPGFFLVTTIAANTFKLRNVLGGAEVSNSTGSPQAGSIRVVGSSSRLSESYKVTALLGTGEESLPSATVTIANNLEVDGARNDLTWTSVTGAVRYRLYKKIDEAYGLIGETDQLTFRDDGVGPDLAIQPPEYDNALETEFPGSVANFQQRQWFGGTQAHQRRVWGSTTGADGSVMLHHERLLLDTDRIRFDVAARERTLVRHIVPMTHLILMASSAELRVTGQNTDVLTPTSIDVRPLSHVGCTAVRPIVVNGNLLWVGERNQHVYEMQPQPGVVREPIDTSVRAAHLFDDYTIVQSAEQRSPVQIEWWLRSDGKLLGMTYMPEQNIRGWHLHEAAGTAAVIESVCVIPDSDDDRLYAVIARTINSSTVRYIERMGRIAKPASLTACKYLDSCITYTGAATTAIPVPHLPGQVVYAVADGKVQGPFTVTTGGSPTITLTKAASTVHVGLLYTPELRLLPPTVLIDGFGKGRELSVNRLSLRVDNTCSFKVAAYQDDDEERGTVRKRWAVDGLDDTRMRSKDVEATIDGGWNRNAQCVITQDVPLPLTIVSATLDVEIGGP